MTNAAAFPLPAVQRHFRILEALTKRGTARSITA